MALLRKKLGMRYLMSVVGLDAGAAAVRGSHGRLPRSTGDGPVLLLGPLDAGPVRRDTRSRPCCSSWPDWGE